MTSLAIVIPLFNKHAFVGGTIASLAMQSAPPEQLIIIDDASTDDSAGAAERALAAHADGLRATRVELVRLPRNGGPGAARNAGIERADSDILLCLDADDSLRKDALALIRAHMQRHDLAMMVLGYASDPPGEAFPDVAALGGDLAALEEDLFLLPSPLRAAAHPEFMMGRASNVAVRRQALGRHRYNIEAWLNEGVDLWYRVLRGVVASGGRAGVCAAPLIRFRISPDSLSHRPIDDWRMLEVPPTVRRCRDSVDPDDRAMAAMLAGRWLAHALEVLPAGEKAQFLAQHGPLLAAMDLLPEVAAR
jgi:glycosyltransferase involved in cell wall biosynthesis